MNDTIILIILFVVAVIIYIIYKKYYSIYYLKKMSEIKSTNNLKSYNLEKDIHTIKNILVYFCVLSIIGLISWLFMYLDWCFNYNLNYCNFIISLKRKVNVCFNIINKIYNYKLILY